MSKVLREIRAGRLGYAVLYTAPSIADAPKARGERCRATSEARQKINLRKSWQQLEVTLFANFCRDDFLVTLTYDPSHLPADRAAAVGRLRKFLARVRAARRKRGQEILYIYVTEDKHGDGRVHHHLVVNGTGRDLDELRALWPDGFVYAQNLRPREFGYLARYLTKEAREYGKQIAKKTWVPSRNLKRPEQPRAETVPDLMTLTLPPNADPLESSGGEVRVGEYGTYSYIKYLLRDGEDYRLPREISQDPEEDLTRWAGERRGAKIAQGLKIFNLKPCITYGRGAEKSHGGVAK